LWRVVLSRLLGVVFTMLIVLVSAGAGTAQHQPGENVEVYVFWQQGCPHCARAIAALDDIAEPDTLVEITRIEVGVDPANDLVFAQAIQTYGLAQAAVPLVAIGDQAFLGYAAGGQSDQDYRDAIGQCLANGCPDIIAQLFTRGRVEGTDVDTGPDPALIPTTLDLPFVGQIATRDLSLPVLTIVLAGIDGFNPCAMWVLVFLIGLLLGLKDERRMWILGLTFLLATAVVYFAFLAAWLNLVLILGALVWVRIAIGILALGVGTYFLREYWINPDPTCRVTRPGQRQRIMDAFKSTVSQNSLALSVLGIIALAFVVNLIELLCSAGLPAVYTQILALSTLSPGGYYAYLLLYVVVFLLDDLAIFAMAMFALRTTGLAEKYTRASHLIGGVVLLVIGALLLLRPDLLSFGMGS